jgi:hypothetical protein
MVNHSEGQGTVGPGTNLQPEIGRVDGIGPSRIDNDYFGTAFLSRLFGSFPKYIPVAGAAAAPHKDTFCIRPNYRKHAPAKKGGAHDTKGPVTDLTRPGMIRGSQQVEKSLSDFIVGPTRPTRGGDRLRTMLFDDFPHAFTDLREGFIPRNFLPIIFAAIADTFARVIQPARMIKIINHVSASRTAFGNGVRRFCTGKIFIRLDRNQTARIDGGR